MTDYPPVPPGCRYFNPRRLRRAAKLQRKLNLAAQARALAAQAQRERREAVRERTQKQTTFTDKLKSRVKGFTSRLFGRKTG